MENLIIKKEGIFTHEFNENLKITEVVPLSQPLSYYYRDLVELEPDLTIGDLFQVLEPYLPKLEDHFRSETRGWPLQPFFESIKGEVEEDLKFTEIQFSWTYQYFEYLDRKTGITDKSLENYIHISALGETDENGIENYSLSFIKLNNIKGVSVKIIKKTQICNGYSAKDPILEFEKGMNLFEFLGALFHEITFYGSPERAQEQLKILDERCDQIYGDSELIPWETIQLEMLEEELVEALEIEDYEWAERVRLEIERIKDENSDKSK